MQGKERPDGSVSGYDKNSMRREQIVRKLKEAGCRITKQRMMLLDIILEEECSCCKEIYYRASKKDPKIGAATVYRMVNTLEEIGAIDRKNMYRISCEDACDDNHVCTIELDDNTVCELSAGNWNGVILAGLQAYGYVKEQNIRSVTVRSE